MTIRPRPCCEKLRGIGRTAMRSGFVWRHSAQEYPTAAATVRTRAAVRCRPSPGRYHAAAGARRTGGPSCAGPLQRWTACTGPSSLPMSVRWCGPPLSCLRARTSMAYATSPQQRNSAPVSSRSALMLSALQPGTADADRPRGLGRRLILPVFSRPAKPAGQEGSALRLRSVL
jgi:hypothetical protein